MDPAKKRLSWHAMAATLRHSMRASQCGQRGLVLTLVAVLAGLVAHPSLSDDAGGDERIVSIVATNDLHGHMESLPLLAGYVANLRSAREADGGGVILLDAGDMFQGTLVSNFDEGKSIIRAYNELGYTAVCIGNHDFDYGPVGRRRGKESDRNPRGALEARAGEARFPFLNANIEAPLT
jgi:2',3'-cyclic-nucleotide 2'-phosphodiesterase (5'-nucleotidase family)